MADGVAVSILGSAAQFHRGDTDLAHTVAVVHTVADAIEQFHSGIPQVTAAVDTEHHRFAKEFVCNLAEHLLCHRCAKGRENILQGGGKLQCPTQLGFFLLSLLGNLGPNLTFHRMPQHRNGKDVGHFVAAAGF